MQRGRKPKPSHLKVLNGSAKKHPDRVNKHEPKAPSGRPPMPRYFDSVAKVKWKELCDLLDEMGVLSSADRTVLEMCCTAYSEYRKLHATIDNHGRVGDDGKAHSLTSSLHKYRAEVVRHMSELGLTPSSRSRVRTDTVGHKDPMADLRERLGFGSGGA